MKRWFFEPGHTAAAFCARHMMITNVRGHFKDVHGMLLFDPDDAENARVEATIDVATLHTGEPMRDAHLKSADFLDAENFPTIAFSSTSVELLGATDADVHGMLTIRGVTRPVTFRASFLGTWQTPWWEGNVDLGPKTRAGFVGRTRINRHDFGVSWNSILDHGGVVVGADVDITLDAEAILEDGV